VQARSKGSHSTKLVKYRLSEEVEPMDAIDSDTHPLRVRPGGTQIEARVARELGAKGIIRGRQGPIEVESETRVAGGESKLGSHLQGQLAHFRWPVNLQVLRGKGCAQQAHRIRCGSPPGKAGPIVELVAVRAAETPIEVELQGIAPLFRSMGGLLAILLDEPELSLGTKEATEIAPASFRERVTLIIVDIDVVDGGGTLPHRPHITVDSVAHPRGDVRVVVRQIEGDAENVSREQPPSRP
jgi:hypothetical protein